MLGLITVLDEAAEVSPDQHLWGQLGAAGIGEYH